MVGLAMLVAVGGSSQVLANESAEEDKTARLRIQEAYGKLPLYFIQNDGQLDKRVKFYERGAGHSTFFTREGVYLLLTKQQGKQGGINRLSQLPKTKTTSKLVKLFPIGANKNPRIVAEDLQQGRVNYFIGDDKSKWRTNIPAYKAVRYEDVYKNIDIKFYGNNRRLEYDIVVKPGADPSVVMLGYQGIDGLKLTGEGELLVAVGGSHLIQRKPYIYQQINGKRVEIAGAFKLYSKTTYGFELGTYNKHYPLIIDPVLTYSTYLGGADEDYGRGIAVDGAGNAYVTGYTYSGDFPTQNAVQWANAGGYDVFVTKLNAAGTGLVYSTYLGGGDDDQGRSIAVDGAGYAYVTGETWSTDFPTASPLQGTNAGYNDVFVVKLDAAGVSLAYSTYLGGTGYDGGYSIAVDSVGCAYITGNTGSDNFPTVSPFQGAYAGNGDAFVSKLDAAGAALTYSTYLGGTDWEEGRGIALDSAGCAYVTGATYSWDFPTQNPIQGGSAGSADVFVSKLDAAGAVLTYSTYLGGTNWDYGWGIAVDDAGNAYVTGETESTNFPTTFNAYQGTYAGWYDAFVSKIDATGANLPYSTYLGGTDGDYGYGIAVDSAGCVYITGNTGSSDFPIQNPIQGTNAGWGDAFVTKLAASGASLDYSTFLGGTTSDWGYGIVLDSAGDVYITGTTNSTDFPTQSPLQGSNAGNYDAFVTKIAEATPPPQGIISGFVTEASYTPVAGARVVLGQGGPPLNFTFTDANGHYEFGGLVDGVYRVGARKPGYGRDMKLGKVQQTTPLGREEFVNLVLSP
jgi:hypothetical protein